MLTTVVDRTGEDGTAKVRSAFEDAASRLAARGLYVAWPVSAEIVAIPIMGATKTASRRHTLFVSADSLGSGMLEGLVAHEMGHMILTESRHPSHDPAVLRRMGRDVPFPREGQPVFGRAFNHVQDIYADDVAFQAGLDRRAYGFFATWIRGNLQRSGASRWHDLGLNVSNGFALGNLSRHALLPSEDSLWDEARVFDREAGFLALDRFARFFASLPPKPDAESFLGDLRALAESMQVAFRSRTA